MWGQNIPHSDEHKYKQMVFEIGLQLPIGYKRNTAGENFEHVQVKPSITRISLTSKERSKPLENVPVGQKAGAIFRIVYTLSK